jgi:GTP-binding protein HflX
MAAVREVLYEIGAAAVPELLAFNKSDVAYDEAKRLSAAHPGSVAFSAQSGDGVDELLTAIGDRLRVLSTVVELRVPFARGDVLASIHREGDVVAEESDELGIRVRARLEPASRHRLREWVVDEEPDAAVVE